MIKNSLKNKIIIIALLILTFVGILSINTIVKAAGKSWIDPNGQGDNNPKVYIEDLKKGQKITFGAWSCNENVFCVQHGQELSLGTAGKIYIIKDCYEITATDIKRNGKSINPNNELLNYAQGIAYILQQDNGWGDDTGVGNGTNEGIAQHVLWKYLHDFGSTYSDKIGMKSGDDQSLNNDENDIYNNAVDICNGNNDNDYYAKYYIFEQAEDASSNQRLILLESTDKPSGPSDPDDPSDPSDPSDPDSPDTKLSLVLNKISSLEELNVDGTTFKISISNVKSGTVEGASFTQNSILGALNFILGATADGDFSEILTVSGGKINLDNIEVLNINENVVITIEEEKALDSFEELKNSITITLQWNSASNEFEIIEKNYGGMKEVEGISIDDNIVEVTVKNYDKPITISGKVWLDGQTGIKGSSTPNGRIDGTEEGIAGVKVYLCNGTGTVKETSTAPDGTYKFENVKYQKGLYVNFEYDGINYIETVGAGYGTRGNDSDAEEIGRDEFNKKFTKINSDGAYSTEGIINLTYDESDETKAIVDTTGEIFKIKASTDEINNYETDFEFNCGLVKREFDMDLTTDLDFVEVKINGKTTDYKYSTDENGNATLDRNGGETTKPVYNQYLYESDYNYNLTDYFVENIDKYTLTEDEKTDLKEDQGRITDADELEVFVTYKINVINQTNKDAYIYQITDYYSDDFNGIVECYYMDGDNKTNIDLDSIGTEDSDLGGYSKRLINLNNKVTNVQTFYIKLQLNNDKLGSLVDNLAVGNYAEISAYGTDEGYIDINSKPGNMINPKNGEIRYEDDTDKAGTLNIMWTDEERTLTGVVWDDSDKDGIYNPETEETINGVTVQLIELREVNGIILEYIWQETETGKGTVDRINLEGNSIEEDVPNGVTGGSGEFKFTGFIPGNYIVRYKYGLDGESYDGNAYKSTYDTSGKNRYQGKSKLDVTEETRYSDAYDNEARRLGEMSIFAGETITNKSTSNLADHWMCADTNKIEAQIANKDNSVEAGVQEVEVDKETNTYTEEYNLSEIDFGLMKRPETEISLEKHLTALSIDVAGEGKILDAKFDLEKYLKGDSFENCIKGNSANLTSIMSTRTERGFWKVETDVNELMNGAELSAEYTYVVSNNTSNPDYLTAQLVNAYEKLSSGFTCEFKFEENPEVVVTLMPGEGEGLYTYQKLLQDLENNTKILSRKDGHSNGYYLGKFYYTGEASTSEKPVTVQVNKIEELLNNEFLFDERINYSSYGDNHNNSSAYTSTSQETLVDYQHIEYDGEGNKIIASGTGNANSNYLVYDKDGNSKEVAIKIEEVDGKERATITSEGKDGYTIVQSRAGNKYLEPISVASDLSERVDIARKYVLTKTLNTNNIKDMLFDSYNAEILSYSVASGRRSTTSTPGNLAYSYSADETKTLANMGNEPDEFWGETIIITAPTGNNNALWIIIGTACAIIIVGGVFGIKKFVLKH